MDSESPADLVITYRDSEGNTTRRRITVYRVDYDDIEAYCHLRKAVRTFKLDRIITAAIAETGEVIEDIRDYFDVAEIAVDGSGNAFVKGEEYGPGLDEPSTKEEAMASQMLITCPNCKYEGPAVKTVKGSFLTELVLWLALVLPGLIYSVWRLTTRKFRCPRCEYDFIVKKGYEDIPDTPVAGWKCTWEILLGGVLLFNGIYLLVSSFVDTSGDTLLKAIIFLLIGGLLLWKGIKINPRK